MKLDEIIVLERRFAELKVLYDNYFSGLERREPLKQREALASALRCIETSGMPGSTQVQFRFNNLRARLQTFETQWNRISRKIEEGQFKRDKLRAERLVSAAPGAAPAVPQGPPARPGLPGETDLRQLHQSYVAARKSTNESVVGYDAMVSSLAKQVPVILEKYKCKSVEFRVVQKDGKTLLKAFPMN